MEQVIDTDPDPGMEQEMDTDPDPGMELKLWTRIRILGWNK